MTRYQMAILLAGADFYERMAKSSVSTGDGINIRWFYDQMARTLSVANKTWTVA